MDLRPYCRTTEETERGVTRVERGIRLSGRWKK
jgi:hypothetical protein